MSGQETIIIRDVPVLFPYQPYPIQFRYMEKVIEALQTGKNALLESPTGSGKTLCLLCATLAWRSTWTPVIDPDQTTRKLPLIIYASRTHSQLQQALRQLKMTSYKPRVSIIASRDSLCVHPRISSQYSGIQLNQQCQMVHTTRKCMYSNHLDEFERNNPGFISEVYDIEDMVHIGQEHEICPYFLALDNAKHADFLFIPYNYLVDPSLRKNLALDVRLEKAIIIFDEAHNVESSCMESSSFDLTSHELARCILDADFCANACSQPNFIPPNNVNLEAEHIATAALLLKENLVNLEGAVNRIELGQDRGSTQPGTYLQTLLSRSGFDLADMHQDAALEAMTNICATRNDNEPCLRKLRECFKVLKRAVSSDIFNHYRVHIHENTDIEKKPKKGFSRAATGGRILSFWCFSSGVTMKEYMALGVHSLLLTSGTLSPLPALRLELDVEFPVVLENEHVINSDQLYLGLIRKGPNGLNLNSSFKNRNRPECIAELGHLITKFSQIIPDGLLVFFPSYPALTAAMDGWKMTSVINHIETYKRVFVEPRHPSELKGCLTAYREAIMQGRGAILMAVCRGKVSEGVDFSDRAARGVIVCGLPFASTNAPRVRLKRHYLDVTTRSPGAGTEWYLTQAWRAVNQAVGRVIRHRNDYGAILLCDERFCSDNGSHLSLWLRRFIQTPNTFNEASDRLKDFFAQPRPAASSSTASTEPDRSNDPRFEQIRPIASLYQKFRLARTSHNGSNDLLDQQGADHTEKLQRPVKVRSRDWGQGVPVAVSQTSISSRPTNGQHSISLPRDIPNLLAVHNSGSKAIAPARQSSDRASRPMRPEAGLGSVDTKDDPALVSRQHRGSENRNHSNLTESKSAAPGLVVRSRDSAQAFVNLLKSSVNEGEWKPISSAIRDVSHLKREKCTDRAKIRESLKHLYGLIEQIPDSKKLSLHKQMEGYLPVHFRDTYNRFHSEAYCKEFKTLVRRKSEESYRKFNAAILQLFNLYKEAKQHHAQHVNKDRPWSDEEKGKFRRCCREIIDILLPLDKSWPNVFSRFLYEDLVDIFKECHNAALAEMSLLSQDHMAVDQKQSVADPKPSLFPQLNRTCQFCDCTAVVAMRSTICRHVGCRDCWNSHMSRSKSCLCSQPVSKGKLEKLHY